MTAPDAASPQPDDARQDTKKRILDMAEMLLLTRGFNAFSYQHISSSLGVKNAAIHYHYPKKNHLGVAVIQRYRRRFQRFVDAQAGLSSVAQLEAYFALSIRYYDQDQQICPSGILSAEYHVLPEDMQTEAAAFVAEMRDWAVQILREGQVRGELQFAGTPPAMAAVMFAALQGALQLARLDPDILLQIKTQLRALLNAPTDA